MGGGRKRQPAGADAQQPAAVAPTIYKASLGNAGAVVKEPHQDPTPITQVQAEELRRSGGEVVVCGPDLAKNRALAQAIEKGANGTYKRCPPHTNAGPHALPHYQPDPRPPQGHTFYETPNRHAF